jgi:hypothetical protein
MLGQPTAQVTLYLEPSMTMSANADIVNLNSITFISIMFNQTKSFMKKMSFEKMTTVQGGVDQATYCATLCCIIANNPYNSAMGAAWATNCAATYACN